MPTTFTSLAVVKAIPTHDAATGLPISPAKVALTLQGHLNELLAQGYEVLSMLTILDAVLCTAVNPAGVCALEEAARHAQQVAEFDRILADV